MAKTNTVQIKLVSSADTGYFYVTKKNPRTKTNKLELKKFDPVARKHVIFKEAKGPETGAPEDADPTHRWPVRAQERADLAHRERHAILRFLPRKYLD